MFQNACRNFQSACRIFQNACRMFQNTCRMFQNVCRMFKKACRSMSLHAGPWACCSSLLCLSSSQEFRSACFFFNFWRIISLTIESCVLKKIKTNWVYWTKMIHDNMKSSWDERKRIHGKKNERISSEELKWLKNYNGISENGQL